MDSDSSRVPLALFVRSPTPGGAKTRLAPLLGAQGAADLYRGFVEDTVRICRATEGASTEIWHTDPIGAQEEQWLNDFAVPVYTQPNGGLGERISAALGQGIERHGCSLVVGSDSPTLPVSLIEAAIAALTHADLVLGPAHDGGYYLIGARDRSPSLDRVRWSTEYALTDTLGANSSRTAHLLPPWYDVDTPADLDLLRFHLKLDSELAPQTRALLR